LPPTSSTPRNRRAG